MQGLAAAPSTEQPLCDGSSPVTEPSSAVKATGLASPSSVAAARYAAPGDPLGPTVLPHTVVGSVLSHGGSSYSPYKAPTSSTPPSPGATGGQRELPPPTPLPMGAPRRQ
eukprot:7162583-Prymnesium_polylepis.1